MLRATTTTRFRKRRSITMLFILGLVMIAQSFSLLQDSSTQPQAVLSETTQTAPLATQVLESIAVKGRAPKTGYSRAEFGDGWAQVGTCDMRNIMLARYLSDAIFSDDGCVVLSGTLADAYTGKIIEFVRGSTTSDDVQIDHVVALSDAWQKGAQQLSSVQRVQFANDPLNLLPVDGAANQEKGDADAASWLPPNKAYRCQYVARQIAVKHKYGLWTTDAEHATMKRILNGCGEQRVPVEKTSSAS